MNPLTNYRKEYKRVDMNNLSFMRNTYLELQNPIPNFKHHGAKRGKWSFFDVDKNPICSINGAKYQKWVKFEDED